MHIYPNLDRYRFSLPRAAELSRAPEKSVRNWMARGVLTIGRRHFLGRYEFTMLDVFRLAIVQTLVENVAISLDTAATVAEALVPCVRGVAFPGNWLILARSPDDGTWLAGWREAPGDLPAGIRTMPHLLIPVGAIVTDLHDRAGDAPPPYPDPMTIGLPTHNPTEET